MCYDIKVLFETSLKRAKRKHDPGLMKVIEEELKSFKSAEYHHVSGYSHPKIPIYSSKNPTTPKLHSWGLIPSWVKDEQSAIKLQNSTLNARIESISEKPAFRKAAKSQHCLIFVDGFYEHHHLKGKTYPHYIASADREPLCLAGLWDEWINPETGEIYTGFSIITTRANDFMEKIHNNPKLPEARMPFLLKPEEEEIWINAPSEELLLNKSSQEKNGIHLKARTVQKLRGKAALGNVLEASKEFIYPELSNLPKFDF